MMTNITIQNENALQVHFFFKAQSHRRKNLKQRINTLDHLELRARLTRPGYGRAEASTDVH